VLSCRLTEGEAAVIAAKRQKEKEKEKEKEIERAKHSGTVPLIQNRKIAKIENKIGIKSEVNNEDGTCEANIVEKSSEEIEFEIDAAPADDGGYSNKMLLLHSTLFFNGC
jgi:DNA/RNA endonuclease YhcR with UshA esterase domain